MRTARVQAGPTASEHNARVRLLYDFYFSKRYDRHMETTNHYATEQALLLELKDHFKGRILDPSCGTGETIKMMLEMFGMDIRHITGNDFSKGMLEIAMQKIGNPYVNFMTCDVADLRLPGVYFGTVFNSYGFHWFIEKEKVANEFNRVLVPDGTLICIEEFPVIVNPSKHMPKSMKQMIEETLERTKLLEVGELVGLLKTAGFELIKIIQKAIDEKHDMFGLVLKKIVE